MCDSVPLHLPPMALNNIEIKRENSVKFLGVIIDENLTWKTIFKSENRKEKLFLKKFIYFWKFGVLYRASHLFDFKNLLKSISPLVVFT